MTPSFRGRALAARSAAVLLAGWALAGCRGERPADDVPVEVDVAVAPTPAVGGPARIVLSVRDSVGAPLEGAEVRVEATMEHAGMTPVFEEARSEGEGRYVIPRLELTMGGDWTLIVRIRLPDGREAVRERSLTVMSAARDDPGG
jgi:hypothetical protein